MPISYRYKIIFIHIPKTAGTSIEYMLGTDTLNEFYTKGQYDERLRLLPTNKFTLEEYTMCADKNRQHYTYREISKLIGFDTLNTFKKISIVRNPYSRLVSEYNFRKTLYIPGVTSFSDLVRNKLSLDKITRNRVYDGHLETQTSFLVNEQGNFNSIDKIYTFENINECVNDVNIITGKHEYPHLKNSNISNWEQYYTPELKELVYNFYKEDFVNFNYSS